MHDFDKTLITDVELRWRRFLRLLEGLDLYEMSSLWSDDVSNCECVMSMTIGELVVKVFLVGISNMELV